MRKISPKRQEVERRFTYGKGEHKTSFVDSLTKYVFKALGLWKIGYKNALKVRLNSFDICLNTLPAGFDGHKILLMTDLHLSGSEKITDSIISICKNLEYDTCILGGDFCHSVNDDKIVKPRLSRIINSLNLSSKTFAILGNHDSYDIGQFLSQAGIDVLLNDSAELRKNDDRIYLVGLDDCHYFQADDLELAQKDVEADAFKIMLCHSPENYKLAADNGYSLYLAGHTHGGQICLPGRIPIIKNASVPRRLVHSLWKHKNMTGYTSTGVGSARTAIRFFCEPEICMITLKQA